MDATNFSIQMSFKSSMTAIQCIQELSQLTFLAKASTWVVIVNLDLGLVTMFEYAKVTILFSISIFALDNEAQYLILYHPRYKLKTNQIVIEEKCSGILVSRKKTIQFFFEYLTEWLQSLKMSSLKCCC